MPRLLPLFFLALSLGVLPASTVCAQVADTVVTLTTRPDLARHLAPYDAAAFVWLDPARDRRVRVHAERAVERRIPASTFKIPHALIALDAGVLDGPDARLEWDPEAYPPDAWWPEAWRRSHTLRSAMEHSVVWYFREVARMLGPEREQHYLELLDYGNRDASANPTSFWLVGPLAVSADEQVDFLRRLWEGTLPVSAEAQATARDIVQVLQERPRFRMRGKTGTVRIEDGMLNWLVGAVEQGDETGYFALWLEGAEWVDASTRVALVEALLADLGVQTNR